MNNIFINKIYCNKTTLENCVVKHVYVHAHTSYSTCVCFVMGYDLFYKKNRVQAILICIFFT